jgi:hypothetical protein
MALAVLYPPVFWSRYIPYSNRTWGTGKLLRGFCRIPLVSPPELRPNDHLSLPDWKKSRSLYRPVTMAASGVHSHPRHEVPETGPKMVNRLEQSRSPYVSVSSRGTCATLTGYRSEDTRTTP